MSKKSQKLLFLLALIAAAVAVKAAWGGGIPWIPIGSGLADTGATSSTLGAPENNPPRLVLNAPSGPAYGGTAGAGSSSALYFGEGNSTSSSFTRIAHTQVPVFTAHSYLVADLTDGTVLAAQNKDARWPTASLTKLMTATVAFDEIPLAAHIPVTPQAFAVDPKDEGTLLVNGVYTASDLLRVMLMPSSNVAAEALADYYGRTRFLAEMNDRAAEWGMEESHFDDPSGLSSANQSSANDLMILAQHIYKDYPDVFAYTDTPRTTVTELTSGQMANVQSINIFAGQPNFVGGKTGQTPEAHDNLVSVFRYHNHPVVIVVLGAGDESQRFQDTTKLLNWFTMNYQ